MTNAVFVTMVIFAMFVLVSVIVVVTVVMVGVSTSHLENGHFEIFRVSGIEFEDILAFLKMEDGDG
jgi:hypothetical protein